MLPRSRLGDQPGRQPDRSSAIRRLRGVAAVLFTAAAVAAANLFVERDSDLVAFVFLNEPRATEPAS